MAKSAAVEAATPQVPDLVRPQQHLDIGAEDISLPRCYLGQPQSASVQEGTVPAYSIFIGNGADDPEPKVVWTEDAGPDAGPIFHVLSVKRGLYKNVGSDLFTWEFGDPDAPDDARTSYDYVVAFPEVDDEVPVKLMLKGASARTAKQINYLLLRHAAEGPSHELAFRLSTKRGSSDKGRWSIAVAKQVPAQAEHVDIAAALATMVGGQETEQAGSTTEPTL